MKIKVINFFNWYDLKIILTKSLTIIILTLLFIFCNGITVEAVTNLSNNLNLTWFSITIVFSYVSIVLFINKALLKTLKFFKIPFETIANTTLVTTSSIIAISIYITYNSNTKNLSEIILVIIGPLVFWLLSIITVLSYCYLNKYYLK